MRVCAYVRVHLFAWLAHVAIAHAREYACVLVPRTHTHTLETYTLSPARHASMYTPPHHHKWTCAPAPVVRHKLCTILSQFRHKSCSGLLSVFPAVRAARRVWWRGDDALITRTHQPTTTLPHITHNKTTKTHALSAITSPKYLRMFLMIFCKYFDRSTRSTTMDICASLRHQRVYADARTYTINGKPNTYHLHAHARTLTLARVRAMCVKWHARTDFLGQVYQLPRGAISN